MLPSPAGSRAPRALSARRAVLLTLLLPGCAGLGSPPDDDVPTVARLTRPARPVCAPAAGNGAAPNWATPLGGLARLQGQNLRPTLRAQAGATLYDLLLQTRTDLNTAYAGPSSADLQALHEAAESGLRQAAGNLRQAPVTDAADPRMEDYIDAIGDDHTYYLEAPAYRSFVDSLSGSPTPTPRFGFSWAPVPQEDGAVLLDVLSGTPADEAGLRRGDTLLAVNGTPLSRGADDEATAANLRAVLSGAAQSGQAVTLDLRRGETALRLGVTPRVTSSSPRPRGRFLDARTYLLRLPTFVTGGTASDTHALLREAQAGGASRLILDLRDNGGGLLTEAIGVAGAFAPQRAGETIEVLDGNDATFVYRDGEVLGGLNCTATASLLRVSGPAAWTGTTRVLVNSHSASASEIVAQILARQGATLYGETTYGVGNSVTVVSPLGAGRGLSVTIGLARALDGQPMSADVRPSPATPDDLRALAHGRDVVLQAALDATP